MRQTSNVEETPRGWSRSRDRFNGGVPAADAGSVSAEYAVCSTAAAALALVLWRILSGPGSGDALLNVLSFAMRWLF